VGLLFNYTLGLVCYTLFIAYGPRNVLPELVDPLLYAPTPEYQLLTREVNHHTNVFPSLHTSLSVTALLLAYRTREVYRRWFAVATVLAVSVVVSTMYLGIHWATDVVIGVGLGWTSVALADRVVGRDRLRDRLPALLSRVRPGTTD
jgi:PAP2 superfamily.